MPTGKSNGNPRSRTLPACEVLRPCEAVSSASSIHFALISIFWQNNLLAKQPLW
jgi:hypothetical protein